MKAPVNQYHYRTEVIANLSQPARKFLLRLRNGSMNRGRDHMHYSPRYLAMSAECDESLVNDVVTELQMKNLITVTVEGIRTKYQLVPQC